MPDQPWKEKGLKKDEWLAAEVAKAVNAGKAWDCETVDFSDPNRPPTCLEVDFPILPINQIAAIEGNAGKPIYQMSKWWARRRSSVFRSMLLAAAMKAPDDPAEAAKKVWDVYYGNHQKKGAFKNLKVADIFMGGGTTIVEGSRLGMQMFGNDLNPVAWFVVKNEMAKVDKAGVEALLADIEAEVKPQIMPFYTCDCPRGHKGKWTKVDSGEVMPEDFDATAIPHEERKAYRYEGPEIIYVFWAKHGPCQVTGCGHRTPIMSSPVMAIKTISLKYWPHRCSHCKEPYDIEEKDARMAPGVPLVVAETEPAYAVQSGYGATCPHCGVTEDVIPAVNTKGKKKKVELSLLVHPEWLRGEAATDSAGLEYGGSAGDDVESTQNWNRARAENCQLIEFRGKLPEKIVCPTTGTTIKTGKDGGTVPGKSKFTCMERTCGREQDVLASIKESGKTGSVAMYAVQGYCPECHQERQLYNGRFFEPVKISKTFDAAYTEWEKRKAQDLTKYWPQIELPSSGFMTHMNNGGIPNHGFTHWWKMFNVRQLVTLSTILKSIMESPHSAESREYVLGAFQQYLRCQNMFCFWDVDYDKLVPHMSNNNYHPKSNLVENCVFPDLGRGNWNSCAGAIIKGLEWCDNPWELVRSERLIANSPHLSKVLKGKSEKTYPGDSLSNSCEISCVSSTNLESLETESFDLIVTDPPFGGLLHYSELADFFYVWMRIAFGNDYPELYAGDHTPKTLEAVANKARHPENPDAFYQRLLTECWKEANRILKSSGILAFTFHHSEDKPWVAVLESLFDSGFYLEATYPLRSDETKGQGSKPGTFGSQKIEYDIVHVCRKRTEEPQPISWAKMRRQVLQDVRRLKEMLEHHQEEGLPEADLQVIRRGKALEYFSLHYGKVYKDEGEPISVLEALVGINQLLDEEAGGTKEAPPHSAEPFTRMFLRLFDGTPELPRDQLQKFLRGTGSAPSDFVDRGWCFEKQKVFYITPPLELAQKWQGKHRKGMTSDYDQAAFLIGACMEGSGINANETLNNANFRPHPALSAVMTWHRTHGATNDIRNTAAIASQLYSAWKTKHKTPEIEQMALFFAEEDE